MARARRSGTATLTCTASLRHFDDAVAQVTMRVGGPTLTDAALMGSVAAAVAVAVAAGFGVRALVRKRKRNQEQKHTVDGADGAAKGSDEGRDETGSVRARGALGRARAALRAAAACALIAGALACAGCAQARMDDASPRLSDVQLTATGAQSEASQSVEIKLTFDQPISAAGAVADDFEVLLNGKELEGGAVALDVRPSAQAVTFVLHPSSTASAGGATGSFFALYQCAFSIAAARDDGALPSVTGATGSCAVLDAPVTGTLPSGLALETVEARAGSSDGGVAAQTTVRVTSPALVRATKAKLSTGKAFFRYMKGLVRFASRIRQCTANMNAMAA